VPGRSDRTQVVATSCDTCCGRFSSRGEAGDDSGVRSRVRVPCGLRGFRTPSCVTVCTARHSAPAMRPFEQRQLTARVLAALEGRVKQFRRREELWPIRIPVEPIALDDVIEEALGDDSRRFDAGTLRSRTLLQLEWGTEARWDARVIALPSKTKLYCDSDGEETRLLASGGRNEGDENDRVFLQILAETGGQAFGIETTGDAPTRVRSSITDRAFLVEFFVNLFEVTGTEASVRTAIPATSRPSSHDFQREVEVWLATALQR
jgi:hypothetical protein